MMEVEVKRVTTVSTITEIDLFIPISQKDQHLDVRLCVCSRGEQRVEDVPGLCCASEAQQRIRNSAEDKKQRQLLNRGQPQQH